MFPVLYNKNKNNHYFYLHAIAMQSFLYYVRMVNTDASDQETQLNLPGEPFVAVRGENYFHSCKNGPT